MLRKAPPKGWHPPQKTLRRFCLKRMRQPHPARYDGKHTTGNIQREEAPTAPADALANPADTNVILSRDTSKEKNDGTVRA